MTKRQCPKCGHELVFKVGQYGQFIACSNYPKCSYTANEDGSPTKRQREVVEWDEHGKPTEYANVVVPLKKEKGKCPYNKCSGDGLLPYYDKDGILHSDIHLFCDCHPVYGLNPEPEHYRPLTQEDFDFACSYSFRSFIEQEITGKPLPDIEPPEPQPEPQVVYRTRPVDKDIEQLRAQNIYLQNKLNEHIDATKKRKQPRPKIPPKIYEVEQ